MGMTRGRYSVDALEIARTFFLYGAPTTTQRSDAPCLRVNGPVAPSSGVHVAA